MLKYFPQILFNIKIIKKKHSSFTIIIIIMLELYYLEMHRNIIYIFDTYIYGILFTKIIHFHYYLLKFSFIIVPL